MTWLNIDWAIQNIQEFNNHAESAANDRLTHRIFSDRTPNGPTVGERVVLLDKLWCTQMFWQADHAVKVIQSLREGEPRILDAVQALGPDTLETQPFVVIDLALWAMPIVLGHDPENPARNTYAPYSFASKYLHWTAPHLFPITDNRARERVNRLQRQHEILPRVPNSNNYGWHDDYPRWIHFYSKLIASLSEAERKKIINADRTSQPVGERCENTLLRILDKAFYWG